ncbi:Reticuline oxidase-like protein [Capsicum annuum]|nr:Reticuline oxidase-like protein [Capsicum annuum]
MKSEVLGFPAGVCPTVGIGGHVSGGGYGNMLRKFGLSVDNVLDARLVDVNGRILDRKSMGEDVFWAIKGGGGASFGVILAFKIQLVQVPQTVTYFKVERFLDQNATDIVVQWQNVASKIDNNLFIRLLIQPVTAKNKEKVEGAEDTKTIRATFIALFLGDSSTLMSLVSKEFPALGLTKKDCFQMRWIDSILLWANFDNTARPEALLNRTGDSLVFLKRKSDYVLEPIPKDKLESIFQKMISLGKVGLVFNPYGGRMNEIPEDETPFPHRAGIIFKIQYSANWNESGLVAEKDYLSQIRDLYSYMTPFVSKNPRQAYLNYRDLDIGTNDQGPNSLEQGRIYGTKYFKNNFNRLVKVKSMADPQNFFKNEQSIPTQTHSIHAKWTRKYRRMFQSSNGEADLWSEHALVVDFVVGALGLLWSERSTDGDCGRSIVTDGDCGKTVVLMAIVSNVLNEEMRRNFQGSSSSDVLVTGTKEEIEIVILKIENIKEANLEANLKILSAIINQIIKDINKAERLESSSSDGVVNLAQVPHKSMHNISGIDNHGDAQNHVPNQHVDVDNDNDVVIGNALVQEVEDESNAPLRRSTRQHIPSSHYYPNEYVLLTDGGEPEFHEEAVEDEHKDQWIEAMQDEMKSLHKNHAYELLRA